MKKNLFGLKPVSTPSKPEAIVDQLLNLFSSRKYRIGDKLPSEFELMEALDVGRSSIRQAVQKLQTIGVLDVRRGSGTYLKRIPRGDETFISLSIGQEEQSLMMALDVRRGLEVEAATLACTRGSDEDIERIRTALEEMERVHIAHGSAFEEDLAFHLSIYEATGNEMFEQIITGMRGPFIQFFARPFDRNDFGANSFPSHRKLYEAIAKRDVEESRAVTSELLRLVGLDICEMSKA